MQKGTVFKATWSPWWTPTLRWDRVPSFALSDECRRRTVSAAEWSVSLPNGRCRRMVGVAAERSVPPNGRCRRRTISHQKKMATNCWKLIGCHNSIAIVNSYLFS
ncbi:hypothetical protein OUZ56_023731 [Daphnia magna]|uniref:Uncharacterized protein n=1 Tax=Daphnia magna TaxID=35525 RepID=A0ABR0AZJ3_9CRUS|nr:hypothetical protein OUZ56_023731 [Daphnia magna]